MLDSMEHFYPDVFKGLQEKARTGNFIPATSGWVQMDENVIDGESLVRQFLYGQKFSKEKFGHYIRFAWQPDVFGHPVTMPQIAHKAGIEFYLFNRPHDPNSSAHHLVDRAWMDRACWATPLPANTRSRWTTSTPRFWECAAPIVPE